MDQGAHSLGVESDVAMSMAHAGSLLAECGRGCGHYWLVRGHLKAERIFYLMFKQLS